MDPNAALANLRQAVEIGDTVAATQAAVDLDEWLSKGGFLPKGWQPSKPVLGYQELSVEDELERADAIATRANGGQAGVSTDGRPWKILPNILAEKELYPKTDQFLFGAWPVVVIETSGYNDLEVIDPFTGRQLWVGQVWPDGESMDPDDGNAVAFGLRAVATAIEQSGFGSDPDDDHRG
jgi:hypothetical protein